MRVYLAGPMSGIKSFNIPAFDEGAQRLRGWGHSVVSPAEMDGPVTRQILMSSKAGDHKDLPTGETWGFYLARDIKLLCDDGIEAVMVLPGWQNSKGARLETFVASALLGMPIFQLTRIGPVPLDSTSLVRAWAGMHWDRIVLPGRLSA